MNDKSTTTGVSDLVNLDIDIGDWIIDLGNPVILVASALLLVSLLLTLRASWRRLYPGKPWRAVVVALINLVAFITILILLIAPQRLHLVEQEAQLITEGSDTVAAGQLDGSNVYVSPGLVATTETVQHLKNANWLLDIAQLQLREPALTSIDVKGFGLNSNQWQSLPADIQVNYEAPSVDGFTSMRWPRTLVMGETLHLNGRYSNQEHDAVLTLRLLDPADRNVDEVRIKSEDYFSLSARPKGRGNLEYILQAWSGETLLSEQAVTTSVRNPAAINIMVEQSAPSFESRQLKNFAAGNGAQVLINTQISRGKSISQSANRPDGAEVTFSPQTLAAQDVLIMDGRALVNLGAPQQQWLAEAITDGLGLLLLADASLLEESGKLNNDLLAGFELASEPNAQATAIPRLPGNPEVDWQHPLPVAAMQLQATDADVLIGDGNGRALVINKTKGLGHIAISLINQSHRWLTNGNQDHWSDYWAALIAAVGRQPTGSYLLPQPNNVFFKTGQRTPICAMSSSGKLVATILPANTDNSQPGTDIPLTADSLGSPRHCGWFWPQHSGWHQIQLHTTLSRDSTLDQMGLFIFDKPQWLAQSRHERVISTNERAAGNASPLSDKKAGKWVSEPLDVFWLYLLLVISASLLWLERKQFYFQ